MPGSVWPRSTLTEPEEPGDERGRRVLVELLRRAHLLDLALVQHDDLVGDLERLLLVVGDEQAGDVDLVVEPAEPGAELVADLGVEGAEGLVEQQHLGPRRQRPRQGHPLALAARELRRDSARRSRRAGPGRAARRPAPGSRPWAACAPSGRTRCSRGPSCGGTARSAGRRTRRPAAGRAAASRPRRSARPRPCRPAPARR